MIGIVSIDYNPAVLDSGYYQAKSSDGLLSDGHYVIGYRTDTLSNWKIFPFDIETYSMNDNKTRMLTSMHSSLFKDLHKFSEICNDSVSGEKYMIEYQYNLGGREFWTESPVWQKGLRVDGLYNFETRGNIRRDDSQPIDSTLIVVYPDDLVKRDAHQESE